MSETNKLNLNCVMNRKLLLSLTSLCLTAVLGAQIPEDGLVAAWSFTGNAQDESGNNHHGTVHGATLTEDRFGNPDAAYLFDGVNDYIAIAPTSLVDNENTITISCWLKREDADAYGLPIHCGNQGRYGIHVIKDSVRVNVTTNSNFDGSAPTEFKTARVHFDQEQWSNIVLRYDGSNLRIYVNGVIKDEVFAEGDIWTAQSSYLAFGVYMLFGNPNHAWYKGILDDVRIYNTALNDEEIAAMYQVNMCTDTVINDTTTYYVSSENFSELSPLIYRDSTRSLKTSIGGCDSTVNYYSQFLFEPTYCTDSIEITIQDTVTTVVMDTTFITVTDTIPVYDTIQVYDTIAVTDTLIIDAVLTGVEAPDHINTLKVYPNPANDHLFIHTGDYATMDGYSLKIINQVGATVYETNVEDQIYEVNLSTWTGIGLYFLQVIDSGGGLIDIRKIILQ
jgi:hypothetical protein